MILNLDSVIAVKTTLSVVQDGLNTLRELSLNTNFKDVVERKIFFDYVIEIKKHYRTMEGILSNKKMPLARPNGMKVSIAKTIYPKQIEGWVVKIQKNMDELVKDPNISILKKQYVYLDILTKVLNGDAYFVGCQQPDLMAA